MFIPFYLVFSKLVMYDVIFTSSAFDGIQVGVSRLVSISVLRG